MYTPYTIIGEQTKVARILPPATTEQLARARRETAAAGNDDLRSENGYWLFGKWIERNADRKCECSARYACISLRPIVEAVLSGQQYVPAAPVSPVVPVSLQNRLHYNFAYNHNCWATR
jgi:hypothetical protein